MPESIKNEAYIRAALYKSKSMIKVAQPIKSLNFKLLPINLLLREKSDLYKRSNLYTLIFMPIDLAD